MRVHMIPIGEEMRPKPEYMSPNRDHISPKERKMRPTPNHMSPKEKKMRPTPNHISPKGRKINPNPPPMSTKEKSMRPNLHSAHAPLQCNATQPLTPTNLNQKTLQTNVGIVLSLYHLALFHRHKNVHYNKTLVRYLFQRT